MVAVERVQDYTSIPKEVKIGRWNEGLWFQGGACPTPFHKATSLWAGVTARAEAIVKS